VKIFLAAIESSREHAASAAQAGAKNVLTSFYYAGFNKRVYKPVWLQCLRQADARLIDSGAFTLRTSVINLVSTSGSQNAVNVDYDAFLAKYIVWLQWLKKNKLGDLWVEQDLGAITSNAWVDAQRLKIIAAGLGEGLINVWHSDKDWDYWVWLLKEAKRPGRSNYVAIEGNQFNRDPLDYTKFLREAYDRGVRVHGFRMTSQEAIQKWPFYSVDSSSWVTPASKGSYVMQSRTGGVVNIRHKGQGLGDAALRPSWYGIMPRKGTTSRLRVDCLVASAKAWIDAERHITAIWEARGVDWDRAIANPKVMT
jgi:hypothetical protein